MSLKSNTSVSTLTPSLDEEVLLVTPATYAASDAGFSPCAKSTTTKRNNGSSMKWDRSLSGKPSRKERPPMSSKGRMEKKPRNIFRRAIHKMRKKRRRATEPVIANVLSPKIDDLDIEPPLLQKYLAKKEHQKKQQEAGEELTVSRSTAMLIFVGLSSGSYLWLERKMHELMIAHGVLVAAFIVAVAVGTTSMFFLSRCA